MGVRDLIHYGLHLGIPLMLAVGWYPRKALPAFLWMLAGWSIDLDHLLANPVFDPTRCSPGFHILHSLPFTGLYFILAAYPRTRWFGLGLMAHLIADAADCILLGLGI